MKRDRERGVALLTVLLLVAVMSALAVGVLDDIRFGLRRAANAETVGQAQWYALGAESLARARLARLGAANPMQTSLAGDWNGRWLSFPIDHGTIRARLTDATGCFNLNSVVQGAADQWTRRDLGIAQFLALLQQLGVPQGQAQGLAEALADWIDSDGQRNTMGAEDDSYANMVRPYRTSGALLSEVSELRTIRGFTPEMYARIRPYICALPTADLSPININTLDADHAVLLSMLTEGGLEQQTARGLILARPPNGWPSVDAFWNSPPMRTQLPPDAVLNQVTLRTRFFNLEAEVEYAGGEAILTSLFEQPAMGPARIRARRWTIDE